MSESLPPAGPGSPKKSPAPPLLLPPLPPPTSAERTTHIAPKLPAAGLPVNDDPTRNLRAVAGGPPAASLMPRVKGYEVLEELGRGGMGVVYKAWQHSLQRHVALKMVLSGAFATDADLERFRSEAMSIARLHHPYLLNIYEIGSQDGLPFFSMEYLDGGSLTRYLRGRPQPPRAACHLVQKLALAMDYAHKQGVIHRDLKPANILFQRIPKQPGKEPPPSTPDAWLTAYDASNPETQILTPDCFIPKITDFGLAKQVNQDHYLTRTGDILGTPAYMAPEQAAGRNQDVGPTTDVYSLGAMLYELITGSALFHGSTAAETILKVTQEEPVSPRKLNRGIPTDLETICLKCLEKNPARRYQSAGEFADDLGRFLAGEPILARKASLLTRGVKWLRRHPAKSVLAVAVILVVALGLGWLTASWRAERAAAIERAKLLQETERLLAEAILDRGLLMAERGDGARGLHWMLRSLDIMTRLEEKTGQTLPLSAAIRRNLASWTHHFFPKPMLLSHRDWVWGVAFSPDGKYAVTAGKDRIAQVWDGETGKPLGPPLTHVNPVFNITFEPRGRFFFTVAAATEGGPAGELRVFEATDRPDEPFQQRGPAVPLPILPAPNRPKRVQVDETGRRVALAVENRVWLYDFHPERGGNGLVKIAELVHAKLITGVVFHGDELISAGHDGMVTFWKSNTGEFRLKYPVAGPVQAIALRRDGKALAVGCTVAGPKGEPALIDATPARSLVLLFDMEKEKPTSLKMPHPANIQSLAFSPNGQILATGSFVGADPSAATAGEVRLWHSDFRSARRGRPLGRVLPHDESVWAIAFSPDSKLLLTGCRDRRARLWNVADQTMVLEPLRHEGNVVNVAFHPSGRFALTASASDPASARLWELPNPISWGRPLSHETDDPDVRDSLHAVAWEADGTHVWTGGAAGVLHRWHAAETRQVVNVELPTKAPVLDFTLLDGDRAILAYCGDGLTYRWSVSAGRVEFLVPPPRPRGESQGAMAVSPDGKTFFVMSREQGVIQRHATRTGDPIGPEIQAEAGLVALAASPDGKWIATSSFVAREGRGKVVLRDAATLEVQREWDHPVSINCLAFAADGDTLITAGDDRLVQLWSIRTGKLAVAPLVHDNPVLGLALSPDGATLATGCVSGPTRLWDFATGRPIGNLHFTKQTVRKLAFRPDGKVLLLASDSDKAAHFLHVPQAAQGTLEHLRVWIEVITGMELGDNEIVLPLDGVAIAQRRERLRELGGVPYRPKADE